MIPDYPVDDTFLTAAEVYSGNVDLQSTPPGSTDGRKLLRGQTNPAENGLYVSEDPGNGAVWVRRLRPTSTLYVLVGVGLDVGRNIGGGPYKIVPGSPDTVVEGW